MLSWFQIITHYRPCFAVFTTYTCSFEAYNLEGMYFALYEDKIHSARKIIGNRGKFK